MVRVLVVVVARSRFKYLNEKRKKLATRIIIIVVRIPWGGGPYGFPRPIYWVTKTPACTGIVNVREFDVVVVVGPGRTGA